MKTDILAYYTHRSSQCDSAVRRLTGSINRYATFRLLTIIGGFIGIYQALELRSVALTFAAFLLVIVVFAWLVKKHSQLYADREYYRNMQRINDNEIENISHGRNNLYSDGASWIDDRHPYASDLDLFGPGSLFQLLNRSATTAGGITLSSWLLSAADRESVLDRQAAVRELAARREWTQEVRTRLLPHQGKDEELQGLYLYLDLPPLFSGRKLLKTYVSAAPFIFLVGVALLFLDSSFRYLLILSGLLNGGLIFLNLRRINQTDRLVGRAGSVLKSFAETFRQIETESWQSPLCLKLQSRIGREAGKRLSDRIAGLSALTDKLDYRLNIVVGILLNFVFVWDLKQVFALESWKENNRQNLQTAFGVVGEFEALISIAGLHANNPGWAFPVVTDPEAYTYLTEKLGHPLIGEEIRITNDFALNDARTIEIVTGSNMAGKSTFLRTVGINAVLAFAGAPVCAGKLEISVMRIVTYMRIRDSLNESTSTFKAELDRLQMILQLAEGPEKVYFLIDEMLRGTNSVDKYRGSRAVIRKLLAAGAAGMVATHDLQLARLQDEYAGVVRNHHFDISVDRDEMRFDYRLKEGECKTFNASLLLRKIGVDV